MDTYTFALGLGLAVGTGLICHSTLSFLFEIIKKLVHSLQRRHFRLGRLDPLLSKREKQKTFSISGIGKIPWSVCYALSSVAGLILLILVGPYASGFKYGFFLLPGLVWLLRQYLIQQQKRFLPGQIRQFLVNVRLHMSLKGSLLLGLENLAITSTDSTMVIRCLQQRLSGSSAHSGLAVLEQMANDLASTQLQQAVQHIQAAQQSGGLNNVDQAIASQIEELDRDLAIQAEEQMQRLPLRITLLAMPFLLGPIVILLFYPLVDRVLRTLSGVSIGGGF